MDKQFVKLSALIDQDFTVESVGNYEFKMWDAVDNKFLTSTSPMKGYQKRWKVTTDKGLIDMSQSQVANMLEGVMHAGKSDIIGATYNVKSNGKTGMEIRYFLNPVKTAQEAPENFNQEEGW